MKRIKKIVYRLSLLFNIKIHDIIFIVQLKFIINFISNSYKRRFLLFLFIILNDENENKIKRLLRKRVRYIKQFKIKIIEYLIY